MNTSVDLLGGAPRPPRYAFSVAVLGARDVMDVDRLRRLLQVLVNRHADTHRIVLISAGGASPELLPWAHDVGWAVELECNSRNPVKEDCAIVAQADAVVVLGDPRPWERLLALAREAKVPTRVYERPPRLPAPREYPPEG